MKIKLTTATIIVLVMSLFTISCISKNSVLVENPSYKIYSRNEERGYIVKFSLKNNHTDPVALVLNHIEQEIPADAASDGNYEVNVIAQSRRILDFKPKKTTKEDGIYFKNGQGNIFKPINFKLVFE